MAAPIEEDRRWFIEQHEYLYGRLPSAESVDHHVRLLQSGMSRTHLMKLLEQQETEAAVKRLFQQVFGRDPSPASIRHWSVRLKNGTYTRKTMLQHLQGTTEALLRENQLPDSPDDQDAHGYLVEVLDRYGLSDLGDWAWEQIKAGHSPERIIQNLREQDAYKDRFSGMALRREAGLSAITEAEYLDYERTARQLMQRSGMPPDFYDQPSDFANLIGQDISPVELQSRITEGWARVAQAPPSVLAAFEQFYGVSGPAELAAYFLDPDKREPELLRRVEAARTAGIGSLYDLDLSRERAEGLFDRGVGSDEAEQGFAKVGALAATFRENVTEQEDLTAEEEGLNAVLGLDATSETVISRRLATREASLAGGGGAAETRSGFGLGAAD